MTDCMDGVIHNNTECYTEESIRKIVDKYIEESLAGYIPRKCSKAKVIHDPVHGSNIFEQYEIVTIDMPIVQKLRMISQTDVAYFVYPAANHSRFEHSLGVSVIASRMLRALNNKKHLGSNLDFEDCLIHVKLAAILHDCGHGPFSHLSESIYEEKFRGLKKLPRFAKAKSHEIIAYYIVTSNNFQHFFDREIRDKYNLGQIKYELLGSMIIGDTDSVDKDSAFLVEIINGTFDADKLDYILRDSHTTGIRMVVDIDRLLYTMIVKKAGDGKTHLAADISGVSVLEEISFDKLMLNERIYHHQKVRAAGCLLKGFFDKFPETLKLETLLRITDIDILTHKDENGKVPKVITSLLSRQLPVRAFCFSSRTLVDSLNLKNIMQMFKDRNRVNEVIHYIYDELDDSIKDNLSVDEIWIDSPIPPKFNEATNCIIDGIGDDNKDIVLRDVFPTDDWHKAFAEYKWRGFVYTVDGFQNEVYYATKKVFSKIFGDEFNQYSATICKIKFKD